MSDFRVRVSKDYTLFCAGHFITYEGGQCEALHGHNYRAACALEGQLGPDSYVFDFVTLKKLLRAVCNRLDHRMLLPRDNAKIHVADDGREVTVSLPDRRYIFPSADCLILPLANTTAELLAEWVAGEILSDLRQRGATGLTALEVEIEETPGQAAVCRIALAEPG